MNREPNVTPMLDVLLVLLILSMLSIDKWWSMPSQLPANGRGKPSVVLQVMAGPKDDVVVDGVARTPDGLSALVVARGITAIDIKGLPGARYEDLFHAVDVSHGAGVASVLVGDR